MIILCNGSKTSHVLSQESRVTISFVSNMSVERIRFVNFDYSSDHKSKSIIGHIFINQCIRITKHDFCNTQVCLKNEPFAFVFERKTIPIDAILNVFQIHTFVADLSPVERAARVSCLFSWEFFIFILVKGHRISRESGKCDFFRTFRENGLLHGFYPPSITAKFCEDVQTSFFASQRISYLHVTITPHYMLKYFL